MTILNVELSNTFNEFRITSNQVIDRLNQFEIGTAVANVTHLYANNITVNSNVYSNVFTTVSNTANLVINTDSNNANSSFIKVYAGANGNVEIVTAGTGRILLNTSNVVVGNANSDVMFTSNGVYDLLLTTNNAFNSAYLRIPKGLNSNVTIEPHGTGHVLINADEVRVGDQNIDATLTTWGTGDLTINTNEGLNSGYIKIFDGVNANVVIEPNGTGQVLVNTNRVRIGDENTDVTLTTWGSGDVILSTNNDVNSGTVRIFDGVNGNVDITTNGTGLTNIKNIRTATQIVSTLASGTSPLAVTSDTVVTNLNADKVDGKDIGTLTGAGGIAYATSTSALAATGAGTSGQAVISGGTGAPTFQNVASANGASSIVARDVNGSFTANAVTVTSISGSGAGLTNLNGSNIATGTVPNARTTGSSANSANSLVLRDADGSFSANAVTVTTIAASNFAGDGSRLNNINASNIALGTIENTRTTGATANGANSLVLRDANGAFSAGIITATTFSGAHAGSGAALDSVNAANIATGTIANARTTGSSANGANLLVLRDANGDFAGRTVTAVTFSGSGSSLTNIPNSATTAASANGGSTIVARDANGSFSAAAISATSFTGIHIGSGAALDSVNAANIATGTIANARTTGASANGANTLVLRDANGAFSSATITATSFSGGTFTGNGSGLTNISPSAINASSANSASSIVARDVNGAFSAGIITASTFSGSGASLTNIPNSATTAASANGASTIVARDANGDFAGRTITGVTFSGSGASLTNIPNSATSASSANGANLIVARDANGSFVANVVNAATFSGSGASLSSLNATSISTGTIANARTTASSANGANLIVTRDANGDFAARTITATNFTGGAFSGDGSGLTNISVSAVGGSSANGANTLVSRDANGSFAANVITASLSGTATLATNATTLQNARTINGVSFNGSANITVTANTTQTLTRGTYLTGSNFNGGTATTWAVDANSANGASTVVARDVNGSFVANVVNATLFSGSGASLTNLNGSNIATGTVPNARTTGATANGASTLVLRDVNGDFAGRTITATTFSGSLDWANVANKPDPVITVTLTGDVTGTASATLADVASNTVTITTTVAANSVALGTDTTGDYVATIGAGTSGTNTSSSGLTITAAAGEGTAATIAHADTSTLSGLYGTSGIRDITFDGLGHVTAVNTAVYLTSEADTLSSVTGRGATTATAISLTNSTASTSTSTGALVVTGGVGIGGALNALSKSFIIKHPTKPGMLLRYGSLEGPELGVYIRGRNRTGIIMLPDYWSGLVDADTITVQLTSVGRQQSLYVQSISEDAIYIGKDGDGAVDCFYTVYAERKDVEKLIVEYPEE